MNRLRDPQWVLILVFLAIIGTVPAIQLVIEARRDDRLRVFDVFNQPPTAANLRAYERGLESVNWAALATRPWVQYAQFAWLGEGGAKALIGRDGWYFYRPGVNYLLTRPEHVPTNAPGSDPLPAILDFQGQLAARGIHLLLMPVPNKESVYPDRLTSRPVSTNGVMAPRTRDLLDRLRAANVEVVNLFEAFGRARASASQSQVPLYLAQDTHWSPAGVKIAAAAAARRLRELGWIALGRTNYTEKTVTIRRLGDILRMLQAPMIERSISPESIDCLQVVKAEDGQPCRETPDAQVLVLGDSFTRIYQQDEPGAAGFAAHLAKELAQPVAALVNDGGGSTLVRRELRDRAAFLQRKKVLVWEFVERDIGLGLDGWQVVALPPAPSTAPADGVPGPAGSLRAKTAAR